MKEIILVILIILTIVISAILIMYNQLVKLRNGVKQAESGIDVYLKQRFDLLPNLIETVKGYAKHEEDLFENVTKLRNSFNGTNDLKTGETLNKEVNKLIAVAENYPPVVTVVVIIAVYRSQNHHATS